MNVEGEKAVNAESSTSATSALFCPGVPIRGCPESVGCHLRVSVLSVVKQYLRRFTLRRFYSVFPVQMRQKA